MTNRLVLLGVVVIVLGVTATILLADAPAGSSLGDLDIEVSQNVWASRSGALSVFFAGVTFLGSAWFLAPMTILVVTLLALRRRFAAAALVGGAMTASWILTSTLKNTVGRGRPDPSDVIGAINTGFAFPSGHTLSSVVFLGLLGGVLMTEMRARRVRLTVPLVALPVAALIGFSRIYLGYHWLSDVLGGWAVAAAVLGVCWLLTIWWRSRTHPSPGVPTRVGNTGRHA